MTDEPATVHISIEPDRIIADVIDAGPPFDPRSAPDPDLSGPVEERCIGGLGLFLMRKLVSELDYVRSAGCNRTSFAVTRSG
jgi:anti-sigma regulatory factor (Ser/Thr protein kinase)